MPKVVKNIIGFLSVSNLLWILIIIILFEWYMFIIDVQISIIIIKDIPICRDNYNI